RGDKRIENRVVAFNKSEICEICKLEDTRNIGPLLAIIGNIIYLRGFAGLKLFFP
ncbi:Hypothetical predicted protein, partial [Mytilus galloprovincialis]